MRRKCLPAGATFGAVLLIHDFFHRRNVSRLSIIPCRCVYLAWSLPLESCPSSCVALGGHENSNRCFAVTCNLKQRPAADAQRRTLVAVLDWRTHCKQRICK